MNTNNDQRVQLLAECDQLIAMAESQLAKTEEHLRRLRIMRADLENKTQVDNQE